tara:strand:+ start:290 stop:1117 length:828 start_codon:yes stop_codon:yes gene_type:complete
MPEGPEVKKIVNRLNKFFQGQEITSVDFYDERYREKQVRDDVDLFLDCIPATVEKIECKGKFIYWTFTNGFIIFHTLGMSGTWRLQNKKPKYGKLSFERGDGKLAHYKDFRRFGTFKIFQPECASEKLNHKLTKQLGPDILNDVVSWELWEERLRKVNHHNITKALMNQRVVAGIGNYIKAEALYRAKISPHRTVESLSDKELYDLYETCLWVIKAAYETRSRTVKDYPLPDGSQGNFRFYFQVFGKRKDAMGNPVIRDKTLDGRTTHWVREIQK